jgi:DNA polymerase-3 subunit delta
MVELAGSALGLLEQELAKVASYVGDRAKIGNEDVRQLVGGWKAETTWAMIDAIRDGNPATALACLNKLMAAGESAPKLLGGINYVFRKFAHATEMSRTGKARPAALRRRACFHAMSRQRRTTCGGFDAPGRIRFSPDSCARTAISRGAAYSATGCRWSC